jgi:5,10-methylene-tetrahydrofolate dehydrogenase/methenyl tetrahydrofolate cyclohydrolase
MFKEEQMTAQIIDGKAIAATIRGEIKDEVDALRAQYDKVPGLATVLVGERKDSQTYVRMKKKACAEVGITSFGHDLPADISQDELLQVVRDLNANPDVHGILVQLPLPDHIDEEEILGAISLDKDVDGFHPINIGRLSMKRRDPLFVPCTPKGCIELLLRTGVQIEGKRAVVLGRSNIVGLPVSMLLLHRNATLTVCHSRTKNLPDVVREADILVAAVGRPEMVRGDWVKPGAVVIDVGVNAVDDPSKEKGYKLVGDVAFDEVKQVAAAITPVPGGVGPMTIAMLLRNTMDSAKRAASMQ